MSVLICLALSLFILSTSTDALFSAPSDYSAMLPANTPTPSYITEDVPEIISLIFREHYVHLSNTVVVVPGCTTPSTRQQENDLLDQLLPRHREFLVLEIQRDFGAYDPASVAFLWFIDSRDAFRSVFRSLHSHRKEQNHLAVHTVVFVGDLPEDGRVQFCAEIFDAFWADAAINVLVLISDAQRTALYTYYAYSNETCGSPFVSLQNYYWHRHSSSTSGPGLQWPGAFFPRKCYDLHACPVHVATFPIPPFVMLSQLQNGTTYFDGIEGIVVRVLSQRLHFTPVLVLPDDNERWGSCAANMTNCTGCLKLLRDGRANFTVGLYGTNTYRGYENVANTLPYHAVDIVFGIPRGRPVPNIDKLLLPFEHPVWVCILACFGAGGLLVLALRLLPRQVRRFVLGRYNPYPLLTMYTVWLGNAVRHCPGRNFARFLLMLWILLAVVLRGGYQSALYDFLRLKKAIAPVDTVQKMVDAQYPVYTSARLAKYVDALDSRIQQQKVVVPSTEIDGLLLRTLDADFSAAVVVADSTIQYMNKWRVHDGQRLLQSPVQIASIQNTIHLDKGSCLRESFNLELLVYISAGFIQAWTSKFLKNPRGHVHTSQEFEALTLLDVSGIFQVYLVLVLLSVAVFLGELWHFRHYGR